MMVIGQTRAYRDSWFRCLHLRCAMATKHGAVTDCEAQIVMLYITVPCISAKQPSSTTTIPASSQRLVRHVQRVVNIIRSPVKVKIHAWRWYTSGF